MVSCPARILASFLREIRPSPGLRPTQDVGFPKTLAEAGQRMAKVAFTIKYPIGITTIRTSVIPIWYIYAQQSPLQKDCFTSIRTAICKIAFIRYCRIHDSRRLPMAPFVQTNRRNLGERGYRTGSSPKLRNFQFPFQ